MQITTRKNGPNLKKAAGVDTSGWPLGRNVVANLAQCARLMSCMVLEDLEWNLNCCESDAVKESPQLAPCLLLDKQPPDNLPILSDRGARKRPCFRISFSIPIFWLLFTCFRYYALIWRLNDYGAALSRVDMDEWR